ncbi:hypothetical protein LZD49_07190 [Dyadobacter sp. CY261]|uniref:hypothetical protein n=1 Tax=Dyadobacter sp. CY261 TaxID=2907203 RepID=UPI001F407C5A|nr:hypothetical protein [Dyadobacter sp. CY261]MCF0070250.1 hypothetical protein [Dyadobacter sp. CY261]
MTELIQITKENAIKAFNSAGPKGKALLQNLIGADVLIEKITDRVKSYEDACEVLGLKPKTINDYDGAVAEFAFHKLERIAKALNEGWKPNWDNSSEWKYYPWFDMRSTSAGGSGFSFSDGVYGNSRSRVGSRLVFRSRELAEYAGETFLDIYRDWMVIE